MVLGSMFVGLPSPAPDTDVDAPQLDSAAASASQPGAHPRMFLTPEKKLGHDTRPYTGEQFIQRYGEAGRDLWLHAPPPVAARYVERRLAPDGRLLKFVDFAGHYGYIALDADAVSFEAVLEEVEQAHCLIALFLGPDDGLDGDLQFPEVYMLRRTSRRVRQISYYDVHWLRAMCWLCGCEGQFEHGAGCSMAWRRQSWICPLVFRCL